MESMEAKSFMSCGTNNARNVIKIGRSGDLAVRENRPTGVPVPFQCIYAVKLEHVADLKTLHFAFGGRRLNENREFFTVGISSVLSPFDAAQCPRGDRVGRVSCSGVPDGTKLQEAELKKKPRYWTSRKVGDST